MKSIKPVISLSLFFFFGIHTLAQLTPDHVASPNAASLGRFGDIPVSYYTGRADVSIPLYKTTQRGVELDISLYYDTDVPIAIAEPLIFIRNDTVYVETTDGEARMSFRTANNYFHASYIGTEASFKM